MLGKLIVFEGVDGSGKSTQFDMMCARFLSENREFKKLNFPRYDQPSSALIKMYLGGEFGDKPDSVNAYAASSFFAVDRYASFAQDWREYYNDGGFILTDRYTTSNVLHQGAKIPVGEREDFFKWLYEYEFDRIGLPKPDMVVYMDIDAELATKRLRMRESETSTNADIHEKDLTYLANSVDSGKQAAVLFGWHSVKCVIDDVERDKNDIHIAIYSNILNLLG